MNEWPMECDKSAALSKYREKRPTNYKIGKNGNVISIFVFRPF